MEARSATKHRCPGRPDELGRKWQEGVADLFSGSRADRYVESPTPRQNNDGVHPVAKIRTAPLVAPNDKTFQSRRRGCRLEECAGFYEILPTNRQEQLADHRGDLYLMHKAQATAKREGSAQVFQLGYQNDEQMALSID